MLQEHAFPLFLHAIQSSTCIFSVLLSILLRESSANAVQLAFLSVASSSARVLITLLFLSGLLFHCGRRSTYLSPKIPPFLIFLMLVTTNLHLLLVGSGRGCTFTFLPVLS